MQIYIMGNKYTTATRLSSIARNICWSACTLPMVICARPGESRPVLLSPPHVSKSPSSPKAKRLADAVTESSASSVTVNTGGRDPIGRLLDGDVDAVAALPTLVAAAAFAGDCGGDSAACAGRDGGATSDDDPAAGDF